MPMKSEEGDGMTIEEIVRGESKNVEFKVMLPKDSEKYIKTVIAFANTQGGRLVIGIDDQTRDVVGVDEDILFRPLPPAIVPQGNCAPSEEHGRSIGETSEKHRRNTAEASEKIAILGRELNNTQRKILNLLAENTHLSAARTGEHMGISRRNVESNMKKLKDQGILMRHGSPKNGYWEIID